MRAASSLLRKAAKGALLPLGAVHRREPGDIVILLYHRIGDEANEIELPAHLFTRQMANLRNREQVLPLSANALADRGGGVIVSFDDGYRDFYESALPVLVEYRIPAILYLITASVGNRDFGRDSLTWPQLREAVASGLVEIGSHTHMNTDLSHSDEATANAEMQRSKEVIEDNLGVPCRHFAYPWAVGSPAADRVARRLFDTAALHAWRTNRMGRIDMHRLGRVPILRNDGMLFFRAKVTGALNTEAWLYRAARRGPWRKR